MRAPITTSGKFDSLHAGRHRLAVVETELRRQILDLAADDRERHARTLRRPRKNKHRVGRPRLAGKRAAQADRALHARAGNCRWFFRCGFRRGDCHRLAARFNAAELPRLFDARRNVARKLGIGLRALQQPFPISDRFLVILALERRRAGHRQRLPVRRIDLAAPLDHLQRLAVDTAALAHRQRVGVIRQ